MRTFLICKRMSSLESGEISPQILPVLSLIFFNDFLRKSFFFYLLLKDSWFYVQQSGPLVELPDRGCSYEKP